MGKGIATSGKLVARDGLGFKRKPYICGGEALRRDRERYLLARMVDKESSRCGGSGLKGGGIKKNHRFSVSNQVKMMKRDSEISSESEKEVEENMETKADQVSSNLDCFSQTVTASNLSRDQVTVPQKFAKVNGFLNKERQKIFLMNEEGKIWESELKIFEARRLKIFRVWRSFCTANKLKVGDSCTFRLVRDKDFVVFQLCSRSKAERNRFVKLTPTLSSLNLGKQHLPVSFTRENGLTNPGKIVMVDKNRTEWSMNLSVDSRNTMYIMSGNVWKQFCAANEVSAGESLTLELVRGGTCPVLKFVSKMERGHHLKQRVGHVRELE